MISAKTCAVTLLPSIAIGAADLDYELRKSGFAIAQVRTSAIFITDFSSRYNVEQLLAVDIFNGRFDADGTRIIGFDFDDHRLIVTNLEGTPQITVQGPFGQVDSMAISPSGDELTIFGALVDFSGGPRRTTRGLFRVSLKTSTIDLIDSYSPLRHGDGWLHLSYTSDAKRLVFQRNNAVYWMPANAAGPHEPMLLVPSGTLPVASWRRPLLAYRDPRGYLAVLDLDKRSGLRSLTSFLVSEGIRWSPDSRYLMVGDNADPTCPTGTLKIVRVTDGAVTSSAHCGPGPAGRYEGWIKLR